MSGTGYRLVAVDGGVFDFGTSAFLGSLGGAPFAPPMVDITPTKDDAGYTMVATDGEVFTFGDAVDVGSISPATALPSGFRPLPGWRRLSTAPDRFRQDIPGPDEATVARSERLSSMGRLLQVPVGAVVVCLGLAGCTAGRPLSSPQPVHRPRLTTTPLKSVGLIPAPS